MNDRLSLASSARSTSGRRVLALALLTCLLAAALAGVDARAESVPDFRIIVNAENPSTALARDFVIDAFLKRTTRWNDGETLRPVDQRSDSSVRRHFSETILQRSVSAVKSYWQQRIFSGRDLPPPELDSDDAVVTYVMKHRGALGYVSGNAKLDKAKAILVQ